MPSIILFRCKSNTDNFSTDRFHLQDWSLKYDQDNPVQPRFDVNAPDLYIPTMAYITYVVLAGLVLGKLNAMGMSIFALL